mmetsp:Transcript_32803/g.73726  ORF Transcript_32803/g.73726 Transcript_32803/m.73726 type:complete len:397 (+) Transcript_32803:240-1430(+)
MLENYAADDRTSLMNMNVHRSYDYQDDDEDEDDESEEYDDYNGADDIDNGEYEEDLEGFEDWNMDDQLTDRNSGDQVYDDGEWNPDAQGDRLPDLIFSQGCEDASDHLPSCISLDQCGSRLRSTGIHSDSTGDVDAVRVMLLGVSDTGRPSVGIDLGYACTQHHVSPSRSTEHSSQQSSSSHMSNLSDERDRTTSSSTARMDYGSPSRNSVSSFSRRSYSPGSDSFSPAQDLSMASPGFISRATTCRNSNPCSPFVFHPPRTPSTPTTPSRRSFVFSEWAANNKQTFVFEGAHSSLDSAFSNSVKRNSPCKFVSTKALTLAMQDAEFVESVLRGLPGVDPVDPRIGTLIEKIKEGRSRASTPVTPNAACVSSISSSTIRPKLPWKSPSNPKMLFSN